MKKTLAAVSGIVAVCVLSVLPIAAAAPCSDLQKTRYWRISHLVYPQKSLPTETLMPALDGFEATLVKQSKDGVWIDIDTIGQSDDQHESQPDRDDFFVPSTDKLYFLEGGMGDDYLGGDSDFGDEAVVMTDASNCIIAALHHDPAAAAGVKAGSGNA